MGVNGWIRRKVFARPLLIRSVFGPEVVVPPGMRSHCEWGTILRGGPTCRHSTARGAPMREADL